MNENNAVYFCHRRDKSMNTIKGFSASKEINHEKNASHKKFEKYSEEDQKKIKELKLENSRLIQKTETFVNENKALKKLAKMPSEDETVREVAKRELTLAAEKKKCKGRSFQSATNCFKKRRFTLKKAVMMK